MAIGASAIEKWQFPSQSKDLPLWNSAIFNFQFSILQSAGTSARGVTVLARSSLPAKNKTPCGLGPQGVCEFYYRVSRS
jgi:hypothetical protein